MTIRLQFARIAEWRGPVVRVHLISPWRAHLGDHAGHCIHHHRQQATDYFGVSSEPEVTDLSDVDEGAVGRIDMALKFA